MYKIEEHTNAPHRNTMQNNIVVRDGINKKKKYIKITRNICNPCSAMTFLRRKPAAGKSVSKLSREAGFLKFAYTS